MSQPFTLVVAGDPDQRTGGYIYDAQIVAALRERGLHVDVVGVAGRFPDADDEAAQALTDTLSALQDHAQVIIDGLAMGSLPGVVAAHAERLDITALLHHPLGDEQGLNDTDQQRFHRSELRGLAHVNRVIVTSRFTERRVKALAEQYALPFSAPITVVEPGVERAPISPAAPSSEPIRLLCVATLTPRKGQDILVQALADVERGHWRCDCFGGARDAAFTARVQTLIEQHQLGDRVTLHGECDAATLEAAYQNAHALVLPSWYEGYGMVVTEALAHGLPVITTTGGALRDTLPKGAGISVVPGDVEALTSALATFCHDEALRTELRAGADAARGRLGDWQAAGEAFANALQQSSTLSAGSKFAADWLSLRETVDARSRSQALVDALANWLSDDQRRAELSKSEESLPPITLADLGCGRGSNSQFLAPRLHHAQRWMLIDHDPALLSEAYSRTSQLSTGKGEPMLVETHCASLTHLDHPALTHCDVVTASALIDLVSQQWIDALAAQCAKHRQALFITLSITGEWCFTNAQQQPLNDPDDHWVSGLFNAHQRRDKGLGDALGGDAHSALANAMAHYGYRVIEAETPWCLAAGKPALYPLMCSLIEGWANAATEQAPEAASRIAQWRDERLGKVTEGKVGIWVGHRDLLALPTGEG
ncbi:glycosyltransferase [Vreelandella zhaodongensis]|uniref:Glycosyltransferase n=1 Tax=Vreelandella zhaodongensis TaxID=1176240 RepID=A0ABX2SSN2_VREZH|nr:glycosyltransferase [Halomonas zhaodongensis]NYS44896.1 glycosyltransferase [Halomonas zhaodongensis]